MERLELYNLSLDITISAKLDEPVWKIIHQHLVDHSRLHNFDLTPYNLSDSVNQYEKSPWVILVGGNALDTGQKLNASPLVGYELTLDALGKIVSKVKNPLNATPLLFVGTCTST
jgi:hypothetical protein